MHGSIFIRDSRLLGEIIAATLTKLVTHVDSERICQKPFRIIWVVAEVQRAAEAPLGRARLDIQEGTHYHVDYGSCR